MPGSPHLVHNCYAAAWAAEPEPAEMEAGPDPEPLIYMTHVAGGGPARLLPGPEPGAETEPEAS